MQNLFVVEAGCVSRTIANDRKTELLAYVAANTSLYKAIYCSLDASAIRTTRVLEQESGLGFHIDRTLGYCLNPGYGWARSHRGAIKWLGDRPAEHANGLIAVMGKVFMRTLVGAAMREIPGGPFVAEGIVNAWQDSGTVACAADIASHRLADPLRGLSFNLS
jgi:hypothetical protein